MRSLIRFIHIGSARIIFKPEDADRNFLYEFLNDCNANCPFDDEPVVSRESDRGSARSEAVVQFYMLYIA